MESNTLYYSLDLVSGNGFTLNAEQRAALQTSMVILNRNYKFSRVLFWGKILGIKNDYFIAQGVGDNEMNSKKVSVQAMTAEVAVAAKGRFAGDPSHEYEHTEIQHHSEGDEILEEVVTVKVNEEKRLAVTVYTIDKEAAVVPRGAYIKNPHGTVQINNSFKGLSPSEAAKLSNYHHFSEPRTLKTKSILEMADLNPCIDFLDPLSEDSPKGSWIVQSEQGGRVCVIRSLQWLGLTFYHVPATPQHGYIYMGHGLKNLDLTFML